MEFINACKNGDIIEATKLYELGADIHSENNEALIWSCLYGHFEIAKWLHRLALPLSELGVHTQYHRAFICSCQNGHLEIAKWLHSLALSHKEHGIDINAQDDDAFIGSCAGGHIETAKWLHSLCTDIHTQNINAFIYSCMNGNLDISKWLYELDPSILSKTIKEYNYVDFDALGISKETAILFECIATDNPFPVIDRIDECIIYSLVHYNMIDHIVKLREQFHFICFDIIDGKITDFAIKIFKSKSARKFFNYV